MNRCRTLFLVLLFIVATVAASAQQFCPGDNLDYLAPAVREYDSVLVSKLPVLKLPERYKGRSLPAVHDNSSLPWFPGIYYQHGFFSCQQYSGISTTFAYEMNRVRNVSGLDPHNRYPAHYTWNFYNDGERYTGVNFIHSFDFIMNQGHMTTQDYGPDTAQLFTGWVSGYDRYRAAMDNRLRKVYRIPVNSAEGILTVKQYLYDHLDGSATGGVVCYTTSSPNVVSILPEGTPEGGKSVITLWLPQPTHGMALVGWNDSIRWDYNEDGQYTNDLDLNGDSLIDARDWEIGGFIFANSYDTWWANAGYCYVMYRAMASDFEEGGVWSNCVFAVEPDSAYQPMLAMKVRLEHNLRNRLRVLAGVSSDPEHTLPEHIMEFPMFNYQGGAHVMQGNDTIAAGKEIEFGLDVTPLLNYVQPGEESRFFLIIDEKDPESLGAGSVKYAGFISCSEGDETFDATTGEVPLVNDGRTMISCTGTVHFTPVSILTDHLPPYVPGQPYTTQLSAGDGTPPYTWSLTQGFREHSISPGYQGITTTPLYPLTIGKPYAIVPLPFSFPFFGKTYDTVYINAYGLLQFEAQHLPYPYTADEQDMLKNVASIIPGYSSMHDIYYYNEDGMWMDQAADHITFRWKLSVSENVNATNNEFEVTLFPDGKYEIHYGPIQNTGEVHPVITGVSDGNRRNYSLSTIPSFDSWSGLSFRYMPDLLPAGLTLAEDGLLSLSEADSTLIYEIPVTVTDDRGLSCTKRFQLSGGLEIMQELSSPSGLLTWNEPAYLKLTLTNRGALPLENIHLTLSLEDTTLTVSDSTETIGTLQPGVPFVVQQAFAFTLDHPAPNRTAVSCLVTASAAESLWQRPFDLTVSAPELNLSQYRVEDGVNAQLDPGETAALEMDLSNTGGLASTNLEITLTSPDTTVTILTPQPYHVDTAGPSTRMTLTALVKAARNVPPKYPVQLTLEATDSAGYSWAFPVSLTLGSKPVALVCLSSNSTSGEAMAAIFDSLHLGYDPYTEISSDLLAYPVIFLILGTEYSGSIMLSPDQAAFFASYLNTGGKLYMESYGTWYYGNNTLLHPMFMYTTQKVPVYYFQEVAGVPGTETAGMKFLYLGSSSFAVFDVAPVEPGFSLLQNTDDPPKCLGFAYAGDDYSTIGTMAEFGRLADTLPPSEKINLMKIYLDFFRVNIDGPYPFFHAEKTRLCRYHSVEFMDDSYDSIQSWQWEFPGGTPSSSGEQNPVVRYDQAGDFDVILTVSDGKDSFSIHRKKYIHVDICEGMEETITPSALRIYPNPAGDYVWIETGKAPNGMDVTLLDLMGRGVRSRSYAPGAVPGTVLFDLQGIGTGIYILKVRTPDTVRAGKIVIR